MTWTSVILIASNSASFLLLSSNNRVHSFYWIREIKHSFITSFSYLNHYFLILVFLGTCYLLVSLRLSWLHRNPISNPVSHTLSTSRYYAIHAPLYFWQPSHVFPKQDTHKSLVLESVPTFFPHSAFCQRFLMQMSIGRLQIIPFLLT
jgi:hypothetical protein